MASDSVANKARVIWTRRRRLREGAGPPEAMLETAGWTRGCRRRRRAVAPVLPDEVVVWEILVRLPAKALLRCRTACRSWNRLTSDPGFLAAHHRRQPSLPLIKFSAMRDGLVVRDRPFEEEDVTLHACDLRRRGPRAERRPVVCLTPYGRRYTFHASCDGLLLLFSYDEFYICNPATRECASFPGMAGTAGVAGMYLHRASGEYRVLHWRWKKTGDAQMTRPAAYYYVLAVGSSEAPRPVIVRSSSGMEAAVLAAGMEHYQSECRPTAPVMLHGCLHWDPGSWRWDRVVVFDTVQETFRSMSSPAPAAASLLEMDGTLGISSCDASDGTVRIWLLQEYGSEAWSLRFRIQLPTMEKTLVVAQVMSLNGETLVCYSDGVFASSSALFRWDNKGGMLKEFRWRTLEPTITGHWFKESLVRHAFFQTQDGAVGLQPCFFQDFQGF